MQPPDWFEGKRLLWAICLCIAMGCGGSDNSPGASNSSGPSNNPPGLTCALGELAGAWRIHYERRTGICPAAADETFIPGATLTVLAATVMGVPRLSECTTESRTLSPDKCSVETRMTCVQQEQSISITWRVETTSLQVGVDRIEAVLTVRGESSQYDPCRSDYNATATRR